MLGPRYLPKLRCPGVVKDTVYLSFKKRPGSFEPGLWPLNVTGGSAAGRGPVGAVLKEAARDAANRTS